jgi:hypothetical protein
VFEQNRSPKGVPAALTLWVAGPDARSLVSALATSPRIRSISFDEKANGGATPVSEIRVTGDDLEALALELADIAVHVGVAIHAITQSSAGSGGADPPRVGSEFSFGASKAPSWWRRALSLRARV